MTRTWTTVFALMAAGLADGPVATPLAAQGSAGDAPEQPARPYMGPIIDMHLHGYTDGAFPSNPAPNPRTGRTSAGTAQEHMERSIEIMRRNNVVLGAICSVPVALDAWTAYAPDMVLRGIAPDDPADFMDPSSFRELARGGDFEVMCEVGAQYEGYSPSDSIFDPYWSIAQAHGIPVGIHTGASFPGTPYRGRPDFRLRFGNPLLLEDMLVEHPELKVYMMHAGGGGPFSEYALMMMGMYPQLYADIAVLTWLPGTSPVLEDFLRGAKEQGMLDRVMFGTDQMLWPEAIELAVERVNGYDFLTVDEKADIFYDNAARYLGLSEDVVARHHEMADRPGPSR